MKLPEMEERDANVGGVMYTILEWYETDDECLAAAKRYEVEEEVRERPWRIYKVQYRRMPCIRDPHHRLFVYGRKSKIFDTKGNVGGKRGTATRK